MCHMFLVTITFMVIGLIYFLQILVAFSLLLYIFILRQNNVCHNYSNMCRL